MVCYLHGTTFTTSITTNETESGRNYEHSATKPGDTKVTSDFGDSALVVNIGETLSMYHPTIMAESQGGQTAQPNDA